jgi:thioredoxin-like negative regulator of GroEL
VIGVLLAPLIAVAVLLVVGLMLAAQRSRQRALVGRVVRRDAASAGTPSILFFTGATCHVCHTAQKPALATLTAALGSQVAIHEIDVGRHPDVARAYRVMTLPTTVLLDPEGVVSDINVGFAPAETLRRQLNSLGIPVAA